MAIEHHHDILSLPTTVEGKQIVEVTLADLLEGIRERKRLLGILDTPERTEAMRNRGTRRTSRKRELLARIEARAREAGLEPLKSYY